MSETALTQAQVEDWFLAQQIDEGMKTQNVGRDEVLKALKK